MPIKILDDFDYKKIQLDPLEQIVRDKLSIDIEHWAKFRHTIAIGTNAKCLTSTHPLAVEIKESYLELGKSHYETVTMLGAAKMSFIALVNTRDPLIFKKSFKEFYMHAGSVLDNLTRLIYIVNVKNALLARDKGKLIRHSIGYGSLKRVYNQNKAELKGYSRIAKNKVIHEIKTVRNNFTHSWPPAIIDGMWPIAMRKQSQYYLWPHDPDEIKRIKREYRKKIPLLQMVRDDWETLEKFQNLVFKKISEDIRKFEKNHNLKIV